MKGISATALAFSFLPCIHSSAADAEPKTVVEKRIVKEMVPKFVDTIAHLGRGEADEAVDLFRSMMPRKQTPDKKEDGPFGTHARWAATFQPLAKLRPDFESVELVGMQKVSGQAYKLTLVSHGKYGPCLFQFRVFTYRGKLYSSNLHFDTNWPRIETQIATIKNRYSKTYRIAPARTAKK